MIYNTEYRIYITCYMMYEYITYHIYILKYMEYILL